MDRKDFKEEGTLLIGVQYKGKTHKDFTIGIITVQEGFDAQDECGNNGDPRHALLALVAKRIKKLGDIPKEDINADLILTMMDIDLEIILEKQKVLDGRLASFRESLEKPEETGTGAS